MNETQPDESGVDAVMELQKTRFAYPGGPPVLQGIDAALRAGRVTALVGVNGCGKSTLLRLMLGRYRPTGGRVLLRGRPVAGLRAQQRAALLSYVPQSSRNDFAFTVAEVVALGRLAHGGGAEAVGVALEALELVDLRNRPFALLSAGQQQRVLLARAMAQAAGTGQAMLLDEPTAAMDLRHAHATMQLVRQLAGEGLSMLVVLQDLNLALRYADEAWVMDAGRIVACGPVRQVLVPQTLEKVYGVSLRSGDIAGMPMLRVEDAGNPSATRIDPAVESNP